MSAALGVPGLKRVAVRRAKLLAPRAVEDDLTEMLLCFDSELADDWKVARH